MNRNTAGNGVLAASRANMSRLEQERVVSICEFTVETNIGAFQYVNLQYAGPIDKPPGAKCGSGVTFENHLGPIQDGEGAL